jgi:hypothetical protein
MGRVPSFAHFVHGSGQSRNSVRKGTSPCETRLKYRSDSFRHSVTVSTELRSCSTVSKVALRDHINETPRTVSPLFQRLMR